MNCALQVLLHTDLLIKKLINYANDKNLNIINKFIELAVGILKIESENNNIIKSYSPITFKNEFYNLHSLFRDGQQDAIKFIRIFII